MSSYERRRRSSSSSSWMNGVSAVTRDNQFVVHDDDNDGDDDDDDDSSYNDEGEAGIGELRIIQKGSSLEEEEEEEWDKYENHEGKEDGISMMSRASTTATAGRRLGGSSYNDYQGEELGLMPRGNSNSSSAGGMGSTGGMRTGRMRRMEKERSRRRGSISDPPGGQLRYDVQDETEEEGTGLLPRTYLTSSWAELVSSSGEQREYMKADYSNTAAITSQHDASRNSSSATSSSSSSSTSISESTFNRSHQTDEATVTETAGHRNMQSPFSPSSQPPEQPPPHHREKNTTPSLEPYVGKLERFELFSTNQCYYLVACDKHGTNYRILKMDRTLIERPPEEYEAAARQYHQQQQHANSLPGGGIDGTSSGYKADSSGPQQQQPPTSGTDSTSQSQQSSPSTQQHQPSTSTQQQQQQQQQHSSKPIYRRLSEFCAEDPNVYTQDEIQDMLDMIHDGNRLQRTNYNNPNTESASSGSANHATNTNPHNHHHHQGGGLKPIAKAYGIVGFIRFLDCYYLTLITKRAKVGSIGGNGIYTIKATETFPLKPAERIHSRAGGYHSNPAAAAASSSSSLYYNAPGGHGQGGGGGGGGVSSSGGGSGFDYNTPGGMGSSGGVGMGMTGGTDPSSVLLSMWNRGKRSVGLGLTNREIAELRYQGLYQVVDLTKNFYFSYTYDITRSLQENFLAMTSQPFPPPPFKDMYAWNFFLTRELEDCTSSLTSYHWVLPIIHGAFMQRRLNDYGRSLNLTLLARRSRHFAGTRYLKRGVSDRGKVANDVEHEQIVHDESTSASSGTFSSYLQVRGSIPTYWTQESSVTMPKPPIELNRVDPTYQATRAHFEDLLKRYGSPIVVLDLVKQSEKREREVRVGDEYRHAIDYINTSMDDKHKIRYCALDYSHISKHRNLNVSKSLNEVATWAVNQTGFFCSAPRWKIVEGGRIEPFDESHTCGAAFLTHHLGVPVFPMEQKGVLRTNCIDCLDRTNVAQFSAGVDALGQQLVVMGIRSSAKLDPSSNIVRMLIDMYVEIGDHIALQYGGSEAHKKVATDGSASNIQGPMGKHKELLTSIRRYYSNAFTDRLKQDAMNLFLGYYIPCRHTVPLWEMENDYYLHNFHVKAGRGSLQSMKGYQRAFAVDWSDDEDEEDVGYDGASTVSVSSPLITRNKAKRGTLTSDPPHLSLGAAATAAGEGEDEVGESWRIKRVRKRCKAQNDALSVWWRVAVQSYIQQRMWMQLGRGPTESLLPPRFERLYQPEKLTQFDKFFARTWATPVRLPHSAQHSHSDEDTEKSSGYRKYVSPQRKNLTSSDNKDEAKNEPLGIDENDAEESNQTIRDFVSSHGFCGKNKQSLRHFIKPHEIIRSNHDAGSPNDYRINNSPPKINGNDLPLSYVGSLSHEKEPCEEYIKYANYSRRPASFSRQFRPEAREEFTRCLYETSLDSDDVEGIRKLAESAHIGSEIRTGPYRGLSQNASAIEVTTITQEQFNTLSNMRDRGELRAGLSSVDGELRRRGVYTAGVREAFLSGLDSFARAEVEYAEIIDTSSLGCRRSDLTTESSMKMYCSFFDDSTPLSRLEMTYMLRDKLPDERSFLPSKKSGTQKSTSSQTPDGKGNNKTSFANKASKLGIRISSSEDILHQRSSSLFSSDGGRAPPGFEQINEDLFARKENKFMVFNGAGVDSWQGTHPVTKVHGIEEDFLVG